MAVTGAKKPGQNRYSSRLIWRNGLGLVAIVFSVSLLHFLSPVQTVTDSYWSLFVAHSLVFEGNTDLDEFSSLIDEEDYRVERIGEHLHYAYPHGGPILAAPFVGLFALVDPVGVHQVAHYLGRLERLIASILVGLTSMAVAVIGLRMGLSYRRALLLSLLFAFATPAWSTASRALWQHSPSILFLALALLLLLPSSLPRWSAAFAAMALVAAFAVRPTNAIPALFLGLYVMLYRREIIVRFLMGGVLFAIPFLLYNLSIYSEPLAPYYRAGKLLTNPHFFEALIGNLISPGRGLFLFTPLLLFSISGGIHLWKAGRWGGLESALAASLLFHWIAISTFSFWWGGYSFGPRFFTDLLPFFIYFLIPVVRRLDYRSSGHALTTALFTSAAIFTLFVHGRGALAPATFDWNRTPVSIDQAPHRVWDWADIQFLRGL